MAGVLFIGLGLRLLVAYWLREDTHVDGNMDAVMTQHIATGKIFPTFFYGQANMGIPEIYVSALVSRLFGDSVFVSRMGKVIFSTLFLLALFGWARDVGGGRAGLAAVLFCLIGPLHLCNFYYCANMLQITLLLWWSVSLSLRPPQALATVGLGVLAGFGWYTNQLLFATLLAMALLLVFTWRRQLWPWPLCAGLFGFALGSWPWWLWNIRHNWQTFSFSGTLQGYSLTEGLQLFVQRLVELFDLTILSSSLLLFAALFYVILLAAAAIAIGSQIRAPSRLRRHMLALLLMVTLNGYVFAISFFARQSCPHYVMPLLPVCTVFVGLGTMQLTRRAPYWGWSPLLGLVTIQGLTAIPADCMATRQNQAIREDTLRVAKFLRQQGCSTLFGDYNFFFWLNVATHGETIVSDPAEERCAEFERAAENAPCIGFLGDFADQIASFTATSGGAVTYTNRVGITLAYGLIPPAQQLRLIAPCEIAGIRQKDGHDVAAALLDRDIATEWAVPLANEQPQTLEIEFHTPLAIQSVRLSCATGRYPVLWQVERQRADGEWERATAPLVNMLWFWSGPRVFWHGGAFRLESFFPASPTRKLRLHFEPMPRPDELHISELFVYAANPATEPPLRSESDALPDLLSLLRTRQVRFAYADRWLANQIHQQTTGAIAASREHAVFDRDADEPHLSRHAVPQPCPLQADSAMIVRQADAPITRATLAALQIPMRETASGPWIIFDFAPGSWQPEFSCYDNLFWTGFACLQNSQRNKQTATHLALLARPEPAQRALRLWPTHQLALRTLGRATPHPALPLAIRYDNGVMLAGLTLDNSQTDPGYKLTLTTYWQFQHSLLKDHPVVFFHFLDAAGKVIFQDDFGLLNELPVDAWQDPYPGELTAISRKIIIPAFVPTGRYSARFGLLNGDNLRRLGPDTTLPTRWRKVLLPIGVNIGGQSL